MIINFTAMYKVGGINNLIEEYPYATASIRAYASDNKTLCGEPRSDFMNLMRGVDADLPWTGFMTGYFVISIYYWCMDQVILAKILPCYLIKFYHHYQLFSIHC